MDPYRPPLADCEAGPKLRLGPYGAHPEEARLLSGLAFVCAALLLIVLVLSSG